IWAGASRIAASVIGGGSPTKVGPWVQVSRLGNPLINEIFIPLGRKDYWNSSQPKDDAQFEAYYLILEVARLMPVLYPSVLSGVPNSPTNPRQDIAIV